MKEQKRSQFKDLQFKYLLAAIVPMIITVIIGLISYFSGLFVDIILDGTILSGITDGIKLFIRCILLYIVFLIWYKKLSKKDNEHSEKEEKELSSLNILKYILTGLLLGFFLKSAGCFILYLVPSLSETYADHIMAINVYDSSIAAVIVFVIFLPFIEEIIYRCITLTYLERFFKPLMSESKAYMTANLISALIYGFYQLSFIHGIVAFILGTLCGFFAKKTDDLLTAVIVHLSCNLAMSLVPISISSYPMICSVTMGISLILFVVSTIYLNKK